MKKLTASAILLISIANSALANSTSENSKNFAGPAVAIGWSSVGTNSAFKQSSNTQNQNYSYGDTSFIGVVNASYLKDVNEKWLIGGGATYDLNSLKTKGAHFDSNLHGNFNTTIQSDNHFSIYAQPTYALSQSTALFFKAAYHQTKINVNDNFNFIINDYKKTLRGIGFGAGTMIFLDKDIFTKFEIEVVDYSKVNTRDNITSSAVNYKLSTTSATLSVGYRF